MTQVLPVKTPVRFLHDLCRKHGTHPNFEFLVTEGQQRVHTCIVLAEGMIAVGSAPSKKKAKRAAVEGVIYKLMNDPDKKPYIEARLEKFGELKKEAVKAVTFKELEKKYRNPVWRLNQLCVSRRWPLPVYVMHDERLAKNCVFTVTCSMQGLTESGSGSSMKKAQMRAAKKMGDELDRMLISSVDSGPGIDEYEKWINDLEFHSSTLLETQITTVLAPIKPEIRRYYCDMAMNNGVYFIALLRIPYDRPNFSSVLYLQEIAAEMQFKISYLHYNKHSSCGHRCLLRIPSLPLVVYGVGNSTEKAQSSAARCALDFLQMILKP